MNRPDEDYLDSGMSPEEYGTPVSLGEVDLFLERQGARLDPYALLLFQFLRRRVNRLESQTALPEEHNR